MDSATGRPDPTKPEKPCQLGSRPHIPLTTKQVTNGTPQVISTDPGLVNEIAAADDQRDFINVQVKGSATPPNTKIDAYRYEGARADLLKRIDPAGTPILSISGAQGPGIYDVAWPYPAAAARRLDLEITVQSAAAVDIVTLEMQTVYRTRGE